MKPVKNVVFAALLVISTALNTLAGDIDQPGTPAPPPPRMTAVITETNTDTQETTIDTADYLYFEVWAALLSMY